MRSYITRSSCGIREVKSLTRRRDPSRNRRPEALWKEQDQIDGRTVEAMVLILRTSGCRWSRESGCLMCGYNVASDSGVLQEDIMEQLNHASERYDAEKMVKIYTSGSFLDENEIGVPLRREIFKIFDESERILVESRPEFITRETLGEMETGRMQLAIGLETSDDVIRQRCVNKGFSFDDYRRAASLLLEMGIPLRTYLLLKPPFLTERESMEDTIRSVRAASPFSESVSINPVNVQRETLVERLWKRGDYRPPWWWTLAEVLDRVADQESRIMSAPSGAGTRRGIHNCGECEDKFIEAVRRFSFEQEARVFEGLICDCRDEWSAVMEVQDAMRTSVDVSRYLVTNED
jgi:hypothetical protein